jgi:hypothetical protein
VPLSITSDFKKEWVCGVLHTENAILTVDKDLAGDYQGTLTLVKQIQTAGQTGAKDVTGQTVLKAKNPQSLNKDI